jgi:hypothetical protein
VSGSDKFVFVCPICQFTRGGYFSKAAADRALSDHEKFVCIMGKPAKKIVWFARGGELAKSGPYHTQVAAVNAVRLANPKDNDVFPPNAFVWPEEVDG